MAADNPIARYVQAHPENTVWSPDRGWHDVCPRQKGRQVMDPIPGDLTVYVPTAESDLRLVLAPGCAIVGGRRAGGNRELVVVDLEDNRYGQVPPTSDMTVYLDCVARAAGRHRTRYPTVARLAVDPNSLVPVGVLDEAGVFRIDEPAALGQWRRP